METFSVRFPKLLEFGRKRGWEGGREREREGGWEGGRGRGREKGREGGREGGGAEERYMYTVHTHHRPVLCGEVGEVVFMVVQTIVIAGGISQCGR